MLRKRHDMAETNSVQIQCKSSAENTLLFCENNSYPAHLVSDPIVKLTLHETMQCSDMLVLSQADFIGCYMNTYITDSMALCIAHIRESQMRLVCINLCVDVLFMKKYFDVFSG